ncbi:F510_1955 family glycosylhydrolase [Sporosarcina ureae]|uniref:F510_1955 family glycosylhydrolase n=1 Tax=Sporosarcina ureae TaxID=1571 RepID=UPI0009DC7304|nr:sialidase [Sporosarcina ureae]ARF16834.1 sialidase [Sporosarcina ureae]
MKKIKNLVVLLVFVVILSSCSKESEPYAFEKVENNKFEHLHGLGYINGGPEIVISTHEGLYEYDKDEWKEATSEKNDYMGFQAIRDGFFSSGHPEPKSAYKNPFGLIKSTDRGASFDKLAFYGEIDFHYLAAGYDSNAIYVINEMPMKEMADGLHYTLDEGATWEKAAMNEFNSEYISNLAAHPSKKEMIAIGSKDGIFISRDFGENFSLFNDATIVLYATLTETGGYYSSYENETVQLKSFTFDDEQEIAIQLPDDTMNPIVFIAVNPEDEKEIVIATHTNDIYLTKDKGLNWNELSVNGELVK